MKSLALSLIVVICAAVAVFWILRLLGVEGSIGTQVSCAVLAGIAFVHKQIKELESKTPRIIAFPQFLLPPYVMTVYCAVIVMVTGQLAGAIGAVLGAGTDIYTRAILGTGFYVILGTVTSFHLGRWVGTRCQSRGALVIILACLIGAATGVGLDFALVPTEFFSQWVTEGKSAEMFFRQVAISATILSLSGLIGWWRGRATQVYELPELSPPSCAE